MLETDTIFSTNEYANLQVDFYEADKNDEEKYNDNNGEDKKINIINDNATPIGVKFEKPLHSQTLLRKNEKEKNIINMSKTFNNKKENNNNININNNINLKQSNNNNEINIINNEMQTAQGEVNDGFEAPPSFINSDNKKWWLTIIYKNYLKNVEISKIIIQHLFQKYKKWISMNENIKIIKIFS